LRRSSETVLCVPVSTHHRPHPASAFCIVPRSTFLKRSCRAQRCNLHGCRVGFAGWGQPAARARAPGRVGSWLLGQQDGGSGGGDAGSRRDDRHARTRAGCLQLVAAAGCGWLVPAVQACMILIGPHAARRTPTVTARSPASQQGGSRGQSTVTGSTPSTGMMVSSLYVVLAAAATTLTGATSVTVTVNPKNITHKVNPFFNGCHSDSVRKAQATQYHPKRPSPHLAHCCFFIGRKHAHTRRPNS
jgi:hypothetical protein